MKAISVFLLFLGTILVLQGYYEQKAKTSCPKQKESIKVVPMSIYEQQLSPSESLSKYFKGMFEDVMTWPTVRYTLDTNKDALETKIEDKNTQG
jgi:hypothetical protein